MPVKVEDDPEAIRILKHLVQSHGKELTIPDLRADLGLSNFTIKQALDALTRQAYVNRRLRGDPMREHYSPAPKGIALVGHHP